MNDTVDINDTVDNGTNYCDCGRPACSRLVYQSDQLSSDAEARHGHPGDDCPDSPGCTRPLGRAFLIENHAPLSLHCLRSLAYPVLGDGVDRMTRQQIVRGLAAPLLPGEMS